MLYKYPYQTELGTITLLANDYGLLGSWFENQEDFGGTFDIDTVDPIQIREESIIIAKAASWLDDYFSGQAPRAIDFQLMPQGTAFQQDVWAEMQKIHYGDTVTLQELVDRVADRQTKGNGTIKAITGAVEANPIVIIVPSHRVLKLKNTLINEDNLRIHLIKHETD